MKCFFKYAFLILNSIQVVKDNMRVSCFVHAEVALHVTWISPGCLHLHFSILFHHSLAGREDGHIVPWTAQAHVRRGTLTQLPASAMKMVALFPPIYWR